MEGPIARRCRRDLLPKFCYRVPKEQAVKLRDLLLESGMAKLVPEEEVPRRAGGGLLLGGLFAVAHKSDVDLGL